MRLAPQSGFVKQAAGWPAAGLAQRAQKLQQQPIQYGRLVEHQPMPGSADPFIPPRRVDGGRRHRDLWLEQQRIAVAPDAEGSAPDLVPGRQGRAGGLTRLEWHEGSAIPVECGGERPRAREISEVSLLITLPAAPFAKEPPAVCRQGRFGDVLLTEEVEVPGLLTLRHRVPAGAGGRANRQHHQSIDPVGIRTGDAPTQGSAPVVPDEMHPVEAQPIQQVQHVGDEAWPAIGSDWVGRGASPKPRRSGAMTR